ncbi:MAG: Branched-chain amino acid aminotransferase [Candidatus Carbobacillus altaicus]|uniref:Branched-chain-amino-acid aminotransferase n=1 Tax=Candidatus Carbonibacillus altaicus TaxID=2163959 RepID=A0A2R6XXS5_9BACL|nr:MAG: Branched-chain amino acid aminotransferase [Candidatus Carbobacillus altaicus]
MFIFLDGSWVTREEATVSVFDHGLLYGDGVFEGIRAYDGVVFRLKEHIDRLYQSAKAILLEIPYTPEEMHELVLELLRKNNFRSAYIRLIVTRGVGDLGLDPFKCPRASVIIIAQELALFPAELYEKGIQVVTVSTRRNRNDVLAPAIKSLNYLNNIMAKIEARRAGAQEALMLNTEGFVAEGTGENVFLVRKNALLTPPAYIGALKGITRQAVIDLAGGLGFTVLEQPFTLHDVYTADEMFFTGTAAEIVPVVMVDGRTIGEGVPGTMTKQLSQAFHDLVRQDGSRIESSVKQVS